MPSGKLISNCCKEGNKPNSGGKGGGRANTGGGEWVIETLMERIMIKNGIPFDKERRKSSRFPQTADNRSSRRGNKKQNQKAAGREKGEGEKE